MSTPGIYRSRAAAAALAIFAGSFGAHRFFLGQWWGVFYLLLCWTGLPFLVAVIEGIVFMLTDQEAWNRKYNDGVSAGKEPILVIAIFVLLVPAIVTLAIFMAIAIPAYQDYTMRAQTAGVLARAGEAKIAVTEFVMAQQRLPGSLAETGYQPRSIPNLREIQFDPTRGLVLQIDIGAESGELVLIPSTSDDLVTWRCKAISIKPRYLPASCRP